MTETPTPLSIPHLAAEIRRSYEPRVVTVQPTRKGEEAVQFLLTPDREGGIDTFSLEEGLIAHAPRPRAKRGTAKVTTPDSFCDLVGYHHGEGAPSAAIFLEAPSTGTKLTGVLDYHDRGAPAHCRHRVEYTLPFSREWTAWTGGSGQTRDQRGFAEWIEDRILDIVDPPAALDGTEAACPEELRHIFALRAAVGGRFATRASMAELSKGLEINADTRAAAKVNLQSGEGKVTFSEEHKDGSGGTVNVPNLFLVSIAVFDRGTRFLLPVRLRYRLKEGRILWAFDLIEPEAAIDTARERLAEMVGERLQLPVFWGSPEA